MPIILTKCLPGARLCPELYTHMTQLVLVKQLTMNGDSHCLIADDKTEAQSQVKLGKC